MAIAGRWSRHAERTGPLPASPRQWPRAAARQPAAPGAPVGYGVVDEADGDLFCITDNGLVLLGDRLAKLINRRLAFNGQVLEDRKPFALREPDRAGEVRRDGIDGGPPFRRDDVCRSLCGSSRPLDGWRRAGEVSAAACSAEATARPARGMLLSPRGRRAG